MFKTIVYHIVREQINNFYKKLHSLVVLLNVCSLVPNSSKK